jgi:hypothetical protein
VAPPHPALKSMCRLERFCLGYQREEPLERQSGSPLPWRRGTGNRAAITRGASCSDGRPFSGGSGALLDGAKGYGPCNSHPSGAVLRQGWRI